MPRNKKNTRREETEVIFRDKSKLVMVGFGVEILRFLIGNWSRPLVQFEKFNKIAQTSANQKRVGFPSANHAWPLAIILPHQLVQFEITQLLFSDLKIEA